MLIVSAHTGAEEQSIWTGVTHQKGSSKMILQIQLNVTFKYGLLQRRDNSVSPNRMPNYEVILLQRNVDHIANAIIGFGKSLETVNKPSAPVHFSCLCLWLVAHLW